MTLTYRTVWISDTHLGGRGCRAAELSRFLKHLRCERLYLVGDIVDMWRLRQRWYWPHEHNEVVRRLLNQARHGCEVIFMPGNHDEAARQFAHLEFGGIRTVPYAVHVTADGRRLLVIHGDQFDLVVKHSRLLSVLGSVAYEWLLTFNRFYNAGRRVIGRPYFSLSQAIKLKVKSACQFISRFEQTLLEEAERRGLDGVVCGHIHKAEVVDGPIQYYNCGDWIEGCTAVVEHHDGRMELIDAAELLDATDEPRPAARLEPEEPAWHDLIRPRLDCEDPDEQLALTFGAPDDSAAMLLAATPHRR